MAKYVKITSEADAKRLYKKARAFESIIVSANSKERTVSDSETTFLQAFENNRKSIATFIVEFYTLKGGIYRYGSGNTFAGSSNGTMTVSEFLKLSWN